jgi:iron-sulfur cluster assembly accessory protein
MSPNDLSPASPVAESEASPRVVTVTEAAVAKVREALAEQSDLGPGETNLRVFVQQGGCCGPSIGLAFDAAAADDVRCESSGMTVVVDPVSLPHVRGAVIDYVDTPEVSGFKVTVPHDEAASCCSGGGCGDAESAPADRGERAGGCGSGGCC